MPPAEKSPKSWDYEALGAKEKGPCRALVWRWPWEEVRRRGQQEVSRLVGLLHTCEDTDKRGWD